MTITITAFERSPDGGNGLARDTRVRWALEEVGQPYKVRLASFRAMKEPAHLALHPFGQIPTYEEGELALFETGAIVLHLAERHAGLLPGDANARARAITWMFAAVNTVEPPILDLSTAKIVEGDKLGRRSACRWSRIASAIGSADSPLAWARWSAGSPPRPGAASSRGVGVNQKPGDVLSDRPRGRDLPRNERAITGYRRYAVAMPKFITIGYGDRQGYDRTPAPIREAAHARDAELQKAGAVMGIAGKPVQVRNAEGSGTTTAQGPFMSSPLPVAGFAIVDAASLEEAIKMVSGCPCAVAHGVIEVWPLET